MKILIPYDGSPNAENALRALKTFGTEQRHEVLFAVTNVWLAESADEFSQAFRTRARKLADSGRGSYTSSLRNWEQEIALRNELQRRIPQMFPLWKIRVETMPGYSLVSSEILEKAETWEADVVLLGARDVFAFEKNGYGAGVLRVLKSAPCSVHLAREDDSQTAHADVSKTKIAVLLGKTADAARIAAERDWSPGSEVCIFAPNAEKALIDEAADALKRSGLKISTVAPRENEPAVLSEAVLEMNPAYLFIEDAVSQDEAENFGRRQFARDLEELLRRAKCPVELVRKSFGKTQAMRSAA